MIFVMPICIDKKSNYKVFCLIVSAWVFVLTIGLWTFMVETQGLEKADIYQLLRKMKTRAQLLGDRAESLRSIQVSLRSIVNLSRMGRNTANENQSGNVMVEGNQLQVMAQNTNIDDIDLPNDEEM